MIQFLSKEFPKVVHREAMSKNGHVHIYKLDLEILK